MPRKIGTFMTGECGNLTPNIKIYIKYIFNGINIRNGLIMSYNMLIYLLKTFWENYVLISSGFAKTYSFAYRSEKI